MRLLIGHHRMLQATNSRRMIAAAVTRVTFLAIAVAAPMFLIDAAATPARAQSNLQPELPTYDTRYYTVHTDVSPDEAREAAVRMTTMAEEYSRRTKDFSGAVRSKFPFYLVRRADDFA